MKTSVWIRLLGLMLALLTLASVLASCGGGGEGTPTGSTGGDMTTGPQEATGPETDENGYLIDSVPELDYENRKFTIIGWKEKAVDFTVEKNSADTVEYATYVRNVNVEDRLNITLNFDVTQNGGNSAQDSYLTYITNAGNAGGSTYDLLGCYSLLMSSVMMRGMTCDLSPYAQIDLSKPWWYESASNNAKINNKIYFVAGALANSIAEESMIIAANLDLIDSYDLEDPREMVLNDEWTLDNFFQMINDTGVDLNQDTTGKDAGDFFGYVNSYTTFMDGFYHGSGLKMLDVDEETGKVILSTDYSGTKALDLTTLLEAKLKTDDCYAPSGGTIISIFTNKRAIFTSTAFKDLLQSKSSINFAYTYLPFPKWQTADLKQDSYYTTVGFPATLFAIPEECTDKTCAAYVLECLASEGYRMVRPVYYDKIRYQMGNSSLDSQMFDIIVGNTAFDLGRLFSGSFSWHRSPVAVYRETMVGIDDRGFVTRRDSVNEDILNSITAINNALFGTSKTTD